MSGETFTNDELIACLPNLRRYAIKLTKNQDSADDLVQASMLRGLVKRHLFQPGTDLRAWLLTMMYNTFINGVRKRARERSVDLEAAGALAAVTNPEAGRHLAEVREHLSRLPRGQRRLIEAAVLTDDNYEELAAFEGVPLGTVRSRLSRGREMLRTLAYGADLSPEEREKIDA